MLTSVNTLVDSSCGTHLHIGVPFALKQHLFQERRSVFGPLAQHWKAHLDQTEDFWGRYLCPYAREDLDSAYPCIRISRRYDTVEFRLPRFRSAAQYVAVVRFCRRLIYMLQTILLPEGSQNVASVPNQLGQDLVTFYDESVRHYHSWLQNETLHPLKQRGIEQPLLFP